MWGGGCECEETIVALTYEDWKSKAMNIRRKQLLTKEKFSKLSLRGEISLITDLLSSQKSKQFLLL